MLNAVAIRSIWKNAFLPVLDFTNLMIGALLAYLIRYNFFDYRFQGIKQIYGWQYLQVSILMSFLGIVVFSFLGLYSFSNKPRFIQSGINILGGIFFVMMGLISFLYFSEFSRPAFSQSVAVSRFVVGIVGFTAFICVLLGRFIFVCFERFLYKAGIGTFQVIIVGENLPSINANLQKRPEISKIHYYPNLLNNNLVEIASLAGKKVVAEIYLISPEKYSQSEMELSTIAEKTNTRFIFSTLGLEYFDAYKLQPIQIGNIFYFEMIHTAISGWQIVLKRLFDLVLSVVFVLIFSPIYLLIAILIKLDSKGPIFYASERVNTDGSIFKMYKFRRLKWEYCTNESDPNGKIALEFEQNLIKSQGEIADRGALYKIKNDERVTTMGKFLEKTSLDELPQFFNVIIGNLSLVGPRAHQPREVKKYSPHHYKVLNIKPGITGLAQTKGRSDLHFEDEVKWDTYYVHNWSFFLDIQILIKTPIVLITGHKR